jgi:cytochrome c553
MVRRACELVLGLAFVAAAASAVHAIGTPAQEPLWAYGFEKAPAYDEPAPPPQNPPTRSLRTSEPVDNQLRLRHLDGSPLAFSLLQTRDAHNVVDWFPGDHPSPMPDVVAHGPKALANGNGCGSCHRPNGRGRSENAQPAGLPYAYIVRQLQDFRLGLRRSADWRKENTPTMIRLASAMSDEEIEAAARYFASIEWKAPFARVVETDFVPKTRIAGNAFVPLERSRALTERIGGRIVEVSNDDRNIFDGEPGNPRVGWTAYVPPGSVAKGREIVTTGGVMRVGRDVVPRTTACSGCHGPDLMGMDDAPPLAGRSASYLARQLYDFQREARIGRSAALMRVVVANLTEQDMVGITAYLASLPPVRTSRPLTQPLGNATR